MTIRPREILVASIAAGLLATAVIAVVAAAQQGPASPSTPRSSPVASDSRALYEARCASCHGKEGKGDGPGAGLLVVRPRDFTSGKYKLRTTESGSIPTDDDLVQSVGAGMHGTSMPDWRAFLSDEQLRSVAGYIKSFSPRFGTESPQLVTIGPGVNTSPRSVEVGRSVYERLKCASCHGSDGMGAGAIATELKDDWGRPIQATRLTEPWTFRGGASGRDVYLRLRTGMNGAPMPSFKGAATDEDLWSLANYVVSLGRKPVWQMNGDEVQAFYRDLPGQDQRDKVGRGMYLLDSLACAYCHSPIRDDGSVIDEFKWAGGQRISLYPFPEMVSYNLTSDRETGLGGWTDDQIKAVLQRGIRPDGSRMFPFPMPWPSYGNLKPEDLDALVAALRTLPAVSNAIPPLKDPNIVSYFWGKFQMLIMGRDIPGPTFSGNAGTPRKGKSWQTR